MVRDVHKDVMLKNKILDKLEFSPSDIKMNKSCKKYDNKKTDKVKKTYDMKSKISLLLIFQIVNLIYMVLMMMRKSQTWLCFFIPNCDYGQGVETRE